MHPDGFMLARCVVCVLHSYGSYISSVVALYLVLCVMVFAIGMVMYFIVIYVFHAAQVQLLNNSV